MHHYLAAMHRYAVFRGRASRAEFWQLTLVFILGSFALSLVSQILFGIEGDGSQVLAGLWTIAHLLPALAVTVRRLHDTDRTGWWVLINLTGIGSIIGFIFALLPGTDGPNRFGLPGDEVDGLASNGRAVAGQVPYRRLDPHAGMGAGADVFPSVNQPIPSAAPADLIGDLERLSKLHATGGLTDDEFAALKAQTLASAKGPAAPSTASVAPTLSRTETHDEGMWR